MANPSVHGVVVLLAAVAAVAGAPGPAHARSDEMAAVPPRLDQTVYRPNCARVEYDEVCLFDPCAADCRPQ